MTNEQFTQAVTDLIDRTKHEAKTGGALAWRHKGGRAYDGDSVVTVDGTVITAKATDISGNIVDPDNEINVLYGYFGYVVLESDRSRRIAEMDRLIERYFAERHEMPDAGQVERLADLCLREELTDSHPDKMTREEYPFISERQFATRYVKESSMKIAEEYGTDGVNHRVPTKRKREKRENAWMDRKVKAKNAEMKRKYREFTKVQPVEIRHVDDIN